MFIVQFVFNSYHNIFEENNVVNYRPSESRKPRALSRRLLPEEDEEEPEFELPKLEPEEEEPEFELPKLEPEEEELPPFLPKKRSIRESPLLRPPDEPK